MKIQKDVSIFILAGGRGKRFWPLSRKEKPKQFLEIFNGKSMLQMTFDRARRLIQDADIYVITSSDQVGFIKKQLPEIKSDNFIIEPQAKGTAAAIGLGAIRLNKKNPEGIMIVMPADQYIEGNEQFKETIKLAQDAAREKDSLITIGIKPTFASCGYGYLKLGKRCRVNNRYVYEVDRFTEKPSVRCAQNYIKSKRYYFNSGTFIWKVSVFLDELKLYMPGLFQKLKAIEKKEYKINTQDKAKRIAHIYNKIKPVSVDYGLMQKTDNIKAVRAKFRWSDLGSLRSFEEINKRRYETNRVINTLAISKDTKNCVIYGMPNHLVSTLGVSNLIIIHTPDVTLVADKDSIQKVKDIVDEISKKKELKGFV